MRLFRRRQHTSPDTVQSAPSTPADALPRWAGAPVTGALRASWERFADIERNGKVVGYDQQDWNRLAFAASLVAGHRVVEVGPGPGVLLHTITDLDPTREVVAVDIRRHSMLRVPDTVRFEIGSITDPTLADRLGAFDCVVCMEVLEHLEVDDLAPALANLRRLTAGRLITTVPFEEPEPVWWHDRPGGHRQSFSRQRLADLFPRAATSRLPRHGVDWIVLVEDADADYAFAELSNVGLLDRLVTTG